MEKLDVLILSTLAQRVFTPERVTLMLNQLMEQTRGGKESVDGGKRELLSEIATLKQRRGKIEGKQGHFPISKAIYV